MGVQVFLVRVGIRVVGMSEPAGGAFDAAGDFDRLIPTADPTFPLLGLIDPYGDLTLSQPSMRELTIEIDRILPQAREGPERNGLRRLRAMAEICTATPDGTLVFQGD